MIVWLKILKITAYWLRLQYFTLNSGLGWHFKIIRFQIAHLKESLDLHWHECHPWEIHNYSNSVLILTWQPWASQRAAVHIFSRSGPCCVAMLPHLPALLPLIPSLHQLHLLPAVLTLWSEIEILCQRLLYICQPFTASSMDCACLRGFFFEFAFPHIFMYST